MRPTSPHMNQNDSLLGLNRSNIDQEMPSRIHREGSGQRTVSRSPLRSRDSSQSRPSPSELQQRGLLARPPLHQAVEQADYLSRNQQLRAQYASRTGDSRPSGREERSQSRPDLLPCRGPTTRSPQRRDQATHLPEREVSPAILAGIGLKSSFGKRLASEEAAAPANRARSYEPLAAKVPKYSQPGLAV